MGVGQRIVRGAAHVGGVLCISRTIDMQRVLTPVYEALGYSLKPETIGSLSDDRSDIDIETVTASLIDSFKLGARLQEEKLKGSFVERARSIEDDHRATASSMLPGSRIGSSCEKAVLEKFKS